jgi:hypothetical protein
MFGLALLSGCYKAWHVAGDREDTNYTSASGYNSDRFDLTDWKITLPIPDKKGKALEVKKLKGFESPYFFNANDGAMVFRAPVDGPTTKNSKYPRSELRERMNGRDAAWTVAEGGVMTATLKIDKAPTTEEGTPGRMVIGQIHGEDDELVRLYWQDNDIYFMNDKSGEDTKEHRFELTDENGQSPDVAPGEVFAYRIEARGDQLEVTVLADNKRYVSRSPINAFWRGHPLYFKAGVYLGLNKSQGARGMGQVSFYALDVGHAPGSGEGGLRLPALHP